MGGKTSTSTSQVSIPPEVLARYNSVNATAQQVAQTPFQQYSTNPNAFVAPITPTQTAGIENTNAAAGMAQPYYQTATGFALAGAQPVNAQPLDVGAYMNPYLQTVLGSTAAQINQNNQQAMAGQTGSAINQGYFGGDRSGIASAVLQGQQNLAAGQIYSGIASDAYNQAMAAAQQQQGVGLGAAQANRAALQQTGDTLAGLGAGAQQAALSGAQAQLGAGQVEQQTQQAGLTALYNQFLQEQSYPFQTAQFLANIAEGTGALSGNTTTTTQPGGLFSDERLKEDMEPIGKGFDGANIYRFRYRGDPTTRIGFSAQEMERKHPEAVREVGGFKAIEHRAATEESAERGGFANAANDNWGEEPRRARQAGGMSQWGAYPPGVNPMSIGELLQAQAQMYGPGFEGAGLYGGSASGMPHGGTSYVPAPMQGSPMMIHGTPPPTPSRTTAADALHSAAGLSGDVSGLEGDIKDAKGGWDWLNENIGSGSARGTGPAYDARVLAQRAGGREEDPNFPLGANLPADMLTPPGSANGGFIRAHRQDGGGFDPSNPQDDDPYGVKKGPGLNIPTAETQHQMLQGTKPPAQGPSPASQLLGAGADVASIAKAAPELGSLASGIGSGISGLLGAGAGAAGAAGAGMAGIGAGIGAGASGLTSLLPFLMLANRGGRVRRADGGDTELDIPDDKSDIVPLQPAKSPDKGGGDQTMSDIMDIAKIAAMAASAAARGGRIGYAAGGEPLDVADDLAGDDPLLANMLHVRGAHHAAPAPEAAGTGPGPAAAPAGGAEPAAPPPAGFAGASPPAAAPEAAGAPSSASGFAPAAGGVLGNIKRLEGTGKNPSSSAVGPGQFIRGTFIRMARKVFPELANASDAEIGALHGTQRGNDMQEQMIPALDAENAAALQAAGFPATPANRHLAWVLGAGGAKKVLHADPSTPLVDLVGQQAVSANARIMAGKTAGDLIGWAAKGMNRAKGGFAGARRGYQTDGLVVDPDEDRRPVLDAAPQVDPAMVEQAKQAANDPAVRALAVQNRAAAEQGDPSAPPAAQAAVAQGGSNIGARAASGLADAAQSGFLPANQTAQGAPDASQRDPDYMTPSEQRAAAAYINADRMTRQQTGQGSEPLHGNILQRAGQWAMQPEHLIPLATGLADMLAAPTKYPLVAITQGLKGGMNAYQSQRAYDLAQAQKDAELGMAQENIEGGIYGRRTERISAIGGLYAQAMQAFDQQYTPMNTLVNGEPGYLGPHNEQIPRSEYMRRRNEKMFDLVGSLGGSGNMSAPIRTMQSIVAPGATNGAQGGQNVLPGGGGVGPGDAVRNPGGAGGAGGGGLGDGVPVQPSGGPAAVAGQQTGRGAGTAPASQAVAKGYVPTEDRAARGDYASLQEPVPQAPTSDLMDAYNPYALIQKGRQEQQFPQTAGQGAIDLANGQAILAGTAPTFSKADPNTPIWGRFRDVTAAQGKYQADLAANQQRGTQVVAAAQAWPTISGNTQAAIGQLNDIYRHWDPNMGSNEKAELVGIFRGITGDKFTPDQWRDFQTAVNVGNKVAALQMIQQVQQGLTGAPAAGLDVSKMATPSPNMSAGARYDLVHLQEAMFLRQQAYMNAVAKYGGQIQDWTRFDTDWRNDNPPEKFAAEATKQMGGYYKGMTKGDMQKYPYYPKDQDELNHLPAGAPVVRWDGKKGWMPGVYQGG